MTFSILLDKAAKTVKKVGGVKNPGNATPGTQIPVNFEESKERPVTVKR